MESPRGEIIALAEYREGNTGDGAPGLRGNLSLHGGPPALPRSL